MRAYLAIKYHPDGRNRQLITILSDALARHDCEVYCVARDLEQWGKMHFSAEDLMRQSLTAIENCDFVLVELSEKGVGVGIEAGYAYAKGKPVVTLARENCDISTTLAGISNHVETYTVASLDTRLTRALEAVRSQTT